MPTIPLYDTSAPPDGYHRVTAPGGHEWWRVVAERSKVIIDFVEGNYCDPAYWSAYRRFLAAPTRVAPPTPREFPLLTVGLLGQVFASIKAKASFRHVDEPAEIGVGESSILWASEGLRVITLKVTNPEGRVILEGQLNLELSEIASTGAGEVSGRGRLTGLLRETARDVVHRIDDDARYRHDFDVRPIWPE